MLGFWFEVRMPSVQPLRENLRPPDPERVWTIQRIVSASDVCPGQKAISNSVGNGIPWLKAALQ